MSRVSKSRKAAVLAARKAYKLQQEYINACIVVNKKKINPNDVTASPWEKPESTRCWNGKFIPQIITKLEVQR